MHGTEFCRGHQSQARPQAEVIAFTKRNNEAKARLNSGVMTKEEYLEWLRPFMEEDLSYTANTSTGTPEKVDIHPRERLMAGREYRQGAAWDGAQSASGAFETAIRDVVEEMLG